MCSSKRKSKSRNSHGCISSANAANAANDTQRLSMSLRRLSFTMICILGNINTASALSSSSPSPISSASASASPMLPEAAYETILKGQIAIIPNFLPPSLIQSLRNDALNLYNNNHFTTDALAAYGTESTTKFDPTKDRTVLKLNQWKRTDIGDAKLRHETFGSIMANLRTDLSIRLNRPSLDTGLSTTKYGIGSTEISYTRFGPGAFLKRHLDEHHEELKGIRGWEKPTRRSVSWLVYLNEDDWDPDVHGGHIRVFQRRTPTKSTVGARLNGDLQIGWLRATNGNDPYETPVFLDGRMRTMDGTSSSSSSSSGGNTGEANCAMYIIPTDGSSNNNRPQYITKTFHPNPVLFLSGGDFFAKKLLIDNPTLAPRFHFLEPPRSAADKFLSKVTAPSPPEQDEIALDVPPLGGTLVLFDSVSVPHEVLPAFGRDRLATSGWYHEDQQEEHRVYTG